MADNLRRPMFAANWKMNKTRGEVTAFLKEFLPLIKDAAKRDVVIAPPFTSLETAVSMVLGSGVKIAAQNMFYKSSGAFTGEISPDMIKDVGVNMVILGHSERRNIFGESDEVVGKKLDAAFKFGLIPILCVGETLSEREAGSVSDVLSRQLGAAFPSISEVSDDFVVAYEPVWAIGTGRTAGPDQAEEAHLIIRNWFKKHFKTGIADHLRILYGGSVKADNITDLMVMPNVDGVLVGGAALEPGSFADIVNCEVL